MKPGVTVITGTIPGRETMLAECVASVQAQTRQPEGGHLIVRDDGWHGLAATYNRLIDMVETEFFLAAGDDDLLEPTILQRLFEERDLHPGYGVYYCWCTVEGPPPWDSWDPCKPYDGDFTSVPVPGLFPTGLVRHLGGYRPVPVEQEGADIDLLKRMLATGAGFYCVQERLYRWRHHGANLSDGTLPQGRM